MRINEFDFITINKYIVRKIMMNMIIILKEYLKLKKAMNDE